jgi:hypothetical protein
MANKSNQNKEDDELVKEAAERLARIFVEQIKTNRGPERKLIDNKMKGNEPIDGRNGVGMIIK